MQLLCLFFYINFVHPWPTKNISTSYTLSWYKEGSGSASGFNDSKNVGINRFGIATIIRLLSARHSCKLDLPLWQRSMNQQSANYSITKSTCLRSNRLQYYYSQKAQRPKKKWISGWNKQGFSILYTSCNFKLVTYSPYLLQLCTFELLASCHWYQIRCLHLST